jgi:hypothetical protein
VGEDGPHVVPSDATAAIGQACEPDSKGVLRVLAAGGMQAGQRERRRQKRRQRRRGGERCRGRVRAVCDGLTTTDLAGQRRFCGEARTRA